MRTVGEIALSISTTSTLEATQTEIAEHKGFGHPDSLCDGAVEADTTALLSEVPPSGQGGGEAPGAGFLSGNGALHR